MDFSNINLALQLLVVGMISVFAALLIVMALSNLLIRFVNRFLPEEAKETPVQNNTPIIPSTHRKAVEQAISIISNGKSEVKDIKKI